ncbi:MAG: hypothetical protein E7379_00725 [Clostridiales bacterium]|nr:hypothetical protein [Clostridiales bacterium]
MQTEKEQANKLVLNLEIALGVVSTISFFIILSLCLYAIVQLNIYTLPIILIVIDIAMFIISITFCMIIEQKAGYFECRKCHEKYTPSFKQTILSPHICRTRYMKCPHCNQKSWSKKVIK